MEKSSSTDIKTIEFNFAQALEQSPINVDDLLKELDTAYDVKSYSADKLANSLQDKLIETKDVDGLIKLLAMRSMRGGDTPAFGAPIPEILFKACNDRNFVKLVTAAKFGSTRASESFRRLGVLRSFQVGATYFDKTWGLGEVRRVDLFNSKVYLNFPTKANHSMSFEYAAETLRVVPDGHLLQIAHRDAETVAAMVKNRPGDIIKTAVMSFGPSTISRLENLLDSYGIVRREDWKRFWTSARRALTDDPLVNVPAKRSDPITIRDSVLLYDDKWFREFKTKRNIPEIFETLSVYENAKDKPEVTPFSREVLTNRLTFAIEGAFLYPPPMFTRLVLMAQRLNVTTPRDELVEKILEDDRFMRAGDKLPVAEAGEMIHFITETRPEAVSVLLANLPRMNYTLMKQTIDVLASKEEFLKPLQDCLGGLLASTSTPATLVVWALRDSKWEKDIPSNTTEQERVDFQKTGILKGWGLPSLYEILEHGIAVCEDHGATGETLRMQHTIKTLFAKDLLRADAKVQAAPAPIPFSCWFAKAFALLTPLQQEALFMRLQTNASIGEPKIQRALVKCMISINGALADKKLSTSQKVATVITHYTSWRTLRARQEEFRRLVEVDIPQNTKDIEFARGYGDLRENFEYQSAKDQQRILLARREEWGAGLEKMRGASFDNVRDYSVIAVGTQVTLQKADGSRLVYSILGEWDNDEELGILSCMSRLAKTVEGHKVGDVVSIPAVVGEEEVTIQAIEPLSQAVRDWIGQPFAESI